MFKRNVLFIVVAAIVNSCIPEDVAKNLVCPKIAGYNTLTLKMTSDTPFPKDFGLSINNEELNLYESCKSDSPSVLLFSDDRKSVRAIIYLPSNDSNYFPNFATTPQSEYLDVTLEQKADCVTGANALGDHPNIAITWINASKISPACNTQYYHGAAELRYTP